MDANPGEAERVSLYIRLTASLRTRLAAGEWTPGSRLPTVKQLAEEYGVALVTVRSALQLLASDGLVTSTRGRGTVVSATVSRSPSRAGHRSAINDRLEFSPGDSVQILSRRVVSEIPETMRPVEQHAPRYMRIENTHWHDGQPFAVIDCVVELSVFRRFPRYAERKSKILKLLLELGNVRIARGRQEITIAYADGRVAGLLRCPVAAALVRVRSWRYDPAGLLLFATDTLYRGDRFIFDVVEENFCADRPAPLVIPSYRGGEE